MARVILSALFLALLSPFVAHAQQTAHAPYAPFSVTLESGSNLFAESFGFNGSQAALKGGFGLSGVQGQWTSTSGALQATFHADPGYYFTSVGLSLGPWSYSNSPSYGGYALAGNWRIPGSNYVGNTDPVETSGASQSGWSGSGDSGTFKHAYFEWWSGGGGEFLSIMGPWGTYPIDLPNVTSFTLFFDSSLSVGDVSGFGVSHLAVTPEIAPIPEPSTWILTLLGMVAAAAYLWRRRR